MIRVLFVCTGNICRSAMAEGVLTALVERHGLTDLVAADSAGTHDYHAGDPPDHRAIRTARARGYELSRQRARRLHAGDFAEFDYVVALDRGHLAHLERLCPEGHEDRIHLLLSFADGGDVPDPYYGEGPDFEYALDLIEAGVDAILARIKAIHFDQ